MSIGTEPRPLVVISEDVTLVEIFRESGPTGAITNALMGSTTWDPPSLADGAIASKDVTVTGATTGMPCFASLSNIVSGVLISAACTATDVVTVTILNKTGSPLDLASGTVTAVQVNF